MTFLNVELIYSVQYDISIYFQLKICIKLLDNIILSNNVRRGTWNSKCLLNNLKDCLFRESMIKINVYKLPVIALICFTYQLFLIMGLFRRFSEHLFGQHVRHVRQFTTTYICPHISWVESLLQTFIERKNEQTKWKC